MFLLVVGTHKGVSLIDKTWSRLLLEQVECVVGKVFFLHARVVLSISISRECCMQSKCRKVQMRYLMPSFIVIRIASQDRFLCGTNKVSVGESNLSDVDMWFDNS